jgi:cytochrome P450
MAGATKTNYDDYIHEPNNKKLDNIPGDDGLPLIGHGAAFIPKPFEFAMEQSKKHGPIFKMNLFGTRSVMILGPDLMQQMLLDQDKNFSSKMGFMERVATFFEGSLIMEDFEHHKHQRRIMQTAFKNDALKHYTKEINGIYDRALSDWEKDEGETIEFFSYIKNLLLEVAAEIFIGEKDKGEKLRKLNKAFVDCSKGNAYILPLMIPGTTYYNGIKGKEYLKKTFQEMVKQKRDSDDMDMLSYFCKEKDEDSNFFSDEDVANQAIFLLFAAHDTTTSAITNTIFYLARNPEVKEKLYEECKSLGKDELLYDDLSDVPYMQKVFYEVQRIRPSVPMIPRRTIRDVKMGDYTIPAHTMISTSFRFTHWMEEYWTEPAKFDPERFSDERAEHKKHPFIFHPFGGGAHKCIGMHFSQMEYKCFIHKFMLKYDFEAKHKKEPGLDVFPLPKPSDNMPLIIKRR